MDFTTATTTETTHFDVLIVGAGISGIGAAYHLKTRLPHKTFAILEAREAIGGTWDLFRYPGIRSDSDLHTFGYAFKPWTSDNAIAGADEILGYLRETVQENDLARHIRFGHKLLGADWSSADARWTVRVQAAGSGEPTELTCGVLFSAAGYYDYAGGFTPHFEGREEFGGTIVHPQQWPEDLDYAGKRVVVIGSGATAVTLVPAMAPDAGHVTMLQRSPTYILSAPGRDPIARRLQRLPERIAFPIVRWKSILIALASYQLSRRRPDVLRSFIRKSTIKQLPAEIDVDVHFKPTYNPWDQRLCLVPDGDLFKAIKDVRASVATGRIATFTEKGPRLESGDELEADIVVTATGLQLLALGGLALTVDGEPVRLPEHMAYKSMMLSGVPNFAFTIGYTNASWTLKADLVSEFVCRVLAHMDAHGYRVVQPVDDDPRVERVPLLDFQAGYVQRSLHLFPKGGSRAPWKLGMSYANDVVAIRHGSLDDGALRFT